MDLVVTAAWLCAVAATWCVSRAWDIDRELHRLLPASIDRKWKRGRERLPITWTQPLWPYLLPARWQPKLHGARGVALIDELVLLVGLFALFFMIGSALITIATG
jgi:hypothetical protein